MHYLAILLNCFTKSISLHCQKNYNIPSKSHFFTNNFLKHVVYKSNYAKKNTKFTKKLTACTSLLSDPKRSITLKMAS